MRNTVLGDLKDYVKRYYMLILLSIASVIFCFGFQSLNSYIRIDTEELINEPGTTLGWLTIGRYGLVFLKRLLGLSVHSALKSGLFFLLFFTMGANLLTFGLYHLSEKNEKYAYWIFLFLYSTSCIWSFQIYFSLQQAEIALAMLLVIAAAFLSVKACFLMEGMSRILPIFLSSVLLVISFGAYQALAAYYIVICIMFFLMCIQRVDYKRMRLGILGIFLQFAIVYAVYSWIAGTWFMATGEYMESQAAWGRLSVLECIKNILRTMKNLLLLNGPRNFSFYTAGIVLVLLAAWVVWKQEVFREKQKFIVFLLSLAAIAAAPLFMTIFLGEMLVSRSQFALPVTAAFFGMYGTAIIRQDRPDAKRRSVICSLLVVFTIAGQAGYNLHLAYADHIRYEYDVDLTEQMVEALEDVGQGEMPKQPVLFVGYCNPELNFFSRRSEMYGWSFYEWDYSVNNPTGATHRIIGFIRAFTGNEITEGITAKLKEEAVELSYSMPVFPKEGSVLATENAVVVKLSEIKERNEIDWW